MSNNTKIICPMLVIVTLVLSACGPSVPTATPTPVSLAEIDLGPLLIQSGDLPEGVTAGQVKAIDLAGDASSKALRVAQVISQSMESNGAIFGSVTVFLFEDIGNTEAMYEFNHARWEGQEGFRKIDEIGDRAFVWVTSGLEVGEVSFTRCGAVVDIGMGTAEEAAFTSYAKRLDKRLAEVICR